MEQERKDLMAATLASTERKQVNAVSHDGPSNSTSLATQRGNIKEWKRLREEVRIELRHRSLAGVSRVWNRSPTLIL
jgi:hypothetical protein